MSIQQLDIAQGDVSDTWLMPQANLASPHVEEIVMLHSHLLLVNLARLPRHVSPTAHVASRRSLCHIDGS